MNVTSSTTLDSVSILLLSLKRICRNLSHLLNALDADVDLFEHILTQVASSIHESSSSSSSIENDQDIEKIEDFYERLCDEQLEPKSPRVTTL
ncbi:unnamed protein product [Adineta steineri]|uniref:Uncharacterized protein n=1 Tax=Adineta steineri TaxID=433720 RepID=A0A814YDH6_9BILA|nr:unnamed protein product [Adineta steineri]CAF1107120.1 unnamed protein product [Adineta steineri]CAF1227533.1 unnamed protein product [Adineta steineri]